MTRQLLCVAVFAAGAFCVQPQLVIAQTQPDPFGIPCEGWSNPRAYPGSSDCMWYNNDDKEFARDAALAGMTEVELGRLAQQKASSEAVKRLGKQMVSAYGSADDELKHAAQRSSIAVPGSLDSKHRAEISNLAKLSGPAFDRAYVREALKNSRHEISEYRDEADSGMHRHVKSFASETLPVLEQQLEALRKLNRSGMM